MSSAAYANIKLFSGGCYILAFSGRAQGKGGQLRDGSGLMSGNGNKSLKRGREGAEEPMRHDDVKVEPVAAANGGSWTLNRIHARI